MDPNPLLLHPELLPLVGETLEVPGWASPGQGLNPSYHSAGESANLF